MPEPKPAAATTDSWATIKTALAERITRRWNALARLSSGTPDTESIESRLTAISEA